MGGRATQAKAGFRGEGTRGGVVTASDEGCDWSL